MLASLAPRALCAWRRRLANGFRYLRVDLLPWQEVGERRGGDVWAVVEDVDRFVLAECDVERVALHDGLVTIAVEGDEGQCMRGVGFVRHHLSAAEPLSPHVEECA